MANRESIKLKFQDDLIPNHYDFEEVFDSYINKIDDKATLAMVQEGTNDECYVTPKLLKTGLQDLAIITGNCYIPNKEHIDNFTGSSIELEYFPIKHSVRVFKNGQLLLEGTGTDIDPDKNPDYTLDYDSGVIIFSESVENRNIEVDYWYKNLDNSPDGAIDLTSLRDVNAVHLTGDETITGNKTFNKTSTDDQAILTLNNSSTGEGFRVNNSNNGKGIVSDNTGAGAGIYSNTSGTGNSIVSNVKPSGTGYAFVGQNDNTNTFTVDKEGNVFGKTFTIKDGTEEEVLLANGSVKRVSDFTLAGGFIDWGNITNNPTTLAGYGITDIKNFGTITVRAVDSDNASCSTAQFVSWYNSTYGFKNYAYTIAKCTWYYVGNNEISDTSIGACEMAGCVIETFSDESGYYTIRITRPTTGVGGAQELIYNDQGSGYSPGWRTILNTYNFNAFSPTLTGGGASGTWGINITGNAATVTNGIYTSGSYSDPSWLTGLSWNKISGKPTTLSGYGITDAVPLGRNITINGVTQNLYSDPNWTISGGTGVPYMMEGNSSSYNLGGSGYVYHQIYNDTAAGVIDSDGNYFQNISGTDQYISVKFQFQYDVTNQGIDSSDQYVNFYIQKTDGSTIASDSFMVYSENNNGSVKNGSIEGITKLAPGEVFYINYTVDNWSFLVENSSVQIISINAGAKGDQGPQGPQGARGVAYLTTYGNSGLASYNPYNGVLNIPNYSTTYGYYRNMLSDGDVFSTNNIYNIYNAECNVSHSDGIVTVNGNISGGVYYYNNPVEIYFDVPEGYMSNAMINLTGTAVLGNGYDPDDYSPVIGYPYDNSSMVLRFNPKYSGDFTLSFTYSYTL